MTHTEAGSSASGVLVIPGWVGLQDQASSQAACSFSGSLQLEGNHSPVLKLLE